MNRKARFEMRLDAEMHERAKALAASADVSMNQLLEGILCWAIPRTTPGRPFVDRDGDVQTVQDERVLWVSDWDEQHPDHLGVSFVLDYSTPRCVVPGTQGLRAKAED